MDNSCRWKRGGVLVANKLYEENYVKDIADAIREKNGTENKYKVSEMGAAVRAIAGAAEPVLQDKFITENGTYTPDNGYDGFGEVTVDVEGEGKEPVLQDKTITINGTYTPDSGYDGFGKVVVNIKSGIGNFEPFVDEKLQLNIASVNITQNITII